MRYISTVGDHEFVIEIMDDNHVVLNGETLVVNFDSVAEQPLFSLLVDGQSYEAFVYPAEDLWQVLLRGRLHTVKVEDEREKRLRAASGEVISEGAEFHLQAPMPGLVIDVVVADGQEVGIGDVLVVLESMKMQNELKSPFAGKVTRLRVAPGDSVEQNQTMLSVV